MANKRKDIMEIKQMLLQLTKKVSNRKIAKQLGMSRNTVNEYVTKFKQAGRTMEELLGMSEDQLDALFSKEETIKEKRYEELLKFFPEVLIGSKQVGFTFQSMWESYRRQHEDGYGYTQFLEHYHRWNRKSEVTLKLKHKAGECLLADYAGDKLYWVSKDTGEVHDVDVFIGCMPASGYTYVEASPSQKKGDLIHSVRHCLNFMGGSPQALIIDNVKSAVSKASKYEAIANRTFRDFAQHYGTVLNPTRPYRPKDKAMVERLVQIVYEQIYFPIRNETFFSLRELNDRIGELLEKLNDRDYKQLNRSRKELFMTLDYPLLSPLPSQPYVMKQFKRGTVQKTAHVYLSSDKHYYSVPYRFIGERVQIHYTDRLVEVYRKHQRIASHHRDRTASGYSTKKEHLPSQHQFYLDWSPAFFIKKAKIIGPNTEQYVRRLFDQNGYAETKYKTAMGIIQLKRQYEAERIERGCQLAILHPITSYQRIVGILEKGLDQHAHLFEPQPDTQSHIPNHDNIRGPQYFFDN
jgi:transposase